MNPFDSPEASAVSRLLGVVSLGVALRLSSERSSPSRLRLLKYLCWPCDFLLRYVAGVFLPRLYVGVVSSLWLLLDGGNHRSNSLRFSPP